MNLILPSSNESWSSLLKKIKDVQGEALVILPNWKNAISGDSKQEQKFFTELAKSSDKIVVASLKRQYIVEARSKGIRVIDRSKDLKLYLGNHPDKIDALRIFSPNVWNQHLRSQLQSMGLLSLPRLRVWILILCSGLLLFFILFRLLPSAEIRITPRSSVVSQTANIFLVQSGALVDIPDRVRTLELVPMQTTVRHSITFDQISKEFHGENAELAVTVFNNTDEQYSIRKNSRIANQAGMIFRIQDALILEPGEEKSVRAVADDLDLYQEIIGERGNVPEGLKWEFPGLPPEDRRLVYGQNTAPGIGGVTDYRTVLSERDLVLAEKELQKELLALANQIIDEERLLENSRYKNKYLERLYYDEFTIGTFSGFVLPTKFLGEEVQSVPVEGEVTYTAHAYDKQAAMDMLMDDLANHTGQDQRLLPESVTLDRLIHHVIDYEDDLAWIKLTVDLTGKQQYILDPLSPKGAKFAKELRERVQGKGRGEAVAIVKNLPEVEEVDIAIWPPWGREVPEILSHITVVIEN